MKKPLLWSFVVVGAIVFMAPLTWTLTTSFTAKPPVTVTVTVTVTDSGYVAHHFVTSDDRSSRKLIRYLAERGRDLRIREIVHLIDGDSETEMGLLRFGFEVENLPRAVAEQKYKLNVLPQLIVKHDEVALYEGGYGIDPAGVSYDDRHIINEVLANRPVKKNEVSSL